MGSGTESEEVGLSRRGGDEHDRGGRGNSRGLDERGSVNSGNS